MVSNLDIVIPTYNREEKVGSLINQLIGFQERGIFSGKVIVVDSSATPISTSTFTGRHVNLTVIKSSHKNQPYQRYLGTCYSKNEYLLFLDDDMDLTDESFFEDFSNWVSASYTGVNLKFDNVNHFLGALDKTIVPSNAIVRVLRTLSGYPNLPPNMLWLAGIRGPRKDFSQIEYLNGGAFIAKRSALFVGLSSTLFDVYEAGLGKGEDAITGYALSRQGIINAHDKVYFLHNDQRNSVYTQNHVSFGKRIAYSRLFLSLEYASLNRSNTILPTIHYLWFAFWRIIGMGLNAIVRPKRSSYQMLQGYTAGFLLAIVTLFPKYLFSKANVNSAYWEKEILADLNA